MYLSLNLPCIVGVATLTRMLDAFTPNTNTSPMTVVCVSLNPHPPHCTMGVAALIGGCQANATHIATLRNYIPHVNLQHKACCTYMYT